MSSVDDPLGAPSAPAPGLGAASAAPPAVAPAAPPDTDPAASQALLQRLMTKARQTQIGRMVDRYQLPTPKTAYNRVYTDLKSLAQEGEPGRMWYEKSSKRILDYVQGNRDEAHKIAQLIAIYSPQTGVPVNTSNAIKAYNRAKSGEPMWAGDILDRDKTFDTIKGAADHAQALEKQYGGGRGGNAGSSITKVPLDDSGKRFLFARHNMDGYENIATADRDLKAHLLMNHGIQFEGRKTNNFYRNLMVHIDPTIDQGSTQDLWMARAFGFHDDAVSNATKYDFMEKLTHKLGKELGWKPHQVQAAIWTAMKTRQEAVKDDVRKEAVTKGLGAMVPGDNGKPKFELHEGNEDAYSSLMRDRALEKVLDPDHIRRSARDFSDFLDQHLAQVPWESTPSRSVSHMAGLADLAPEKRADYHKRISEALQDEDGNDLLAKHLGMLSPGTVEAPGYWQGDTNPASHLQVATTRIKAAEQRPDIDAASKKLLEAYVNARGLLLKQDGVGYYRPHYDPQITRANGLEYKFDQALSAAEIKDLGSYIDKIPNTAMIPKGPDRFHIVHLGVKDPITPLARGIPLADHRRWHKAVDQALSGFHSGAITAERRAFGSDGELRENDWKENPDGEDYRQRLSAAGRPDVLRFVSDVLAPKVEAVDKAFAQEHGLKRDTRLEKAIRASGRPQGVNLLRGLGRRPQKAGGGSVTRDKDFYDAVWRAEKALRARGGRAAFQDGGCAPGLPGGNSPMPFGANLGTTGAGVTPATTQSQTGGGMGGMPLGGGGMPMGGGQPQALPPGLTMPAGYGSDAYRKWQSTQGGGSINSGAPQQSQQNASPYGGLGSLLQMFMSRFGRAEGGAVTKAAGGSVDMGSTPYSAAEGPPGEPGQGAKKASGVAGLLGSGSSGSGTPGNPANAKEFLQQLANDPKTDPTTRVYAAGSLSSGAYTGSQGQEATKPPGMADGGPVNDQDGDQATHTATGKRFWSGAFDPLDGHILETHPYKRAEASDFHHSMYFSPRAQQAMQEDRAHFFWVDRGKVNTEWRQAAAKPHIIRAIQDQIKLDRPKKADGGPVTDDQVLASPPQPGSALDTPDYIKPIDENARKLSPIGLYSHAAEETWKSPLMKGSPAQFKGMLTKRGVKPDEFKWSGYDQAFAGKNVVSKREVRDHFVRHLPRIEESVKARDESKADYGYDYDPDEDADDRTKYHQYQLPGGKNYREVVLHLPRTPMSQGERNEAAHLQQKQGRTPEEQQRLADLTRRFDDSHKVYQSSHWDEPNPLLHLRMSDRKGPEVPKYQWVNRHSGNGTRTFDSEDEAQQHLKTLPEKLHQDLYLRKVKKPEKILHLEELQSDWGQEARDKGVKTGAEQDYEKWHADALQRARQKLTDELSGHFSSDRARDNVRDKALASMANREQGHDALANYLDEKPKADELWKARLKDQEGVPPAPYVDSTAKWTDLGLKRALHEAAKGGYDRLAVTPGEEQAKRYDLSKHIDRVVYFPKTRQLSMYPLTQRTNPIHHKGIEPEKLDDYVGKDVAKKLLATKPQDTTPYDGPAHVLDGANLKVEHKGMKGYYDTILPKALEKLARQHDPEARVQLHAKVQDAPTVHGTARIERQRPALTLHALDITPRMRASILAGHKAYASGGRVSERLHDDIYQKLRKTIDVGGRYADGGAVKPKPLTRDKFFRHYSQHVDYGGRDKLTDDERLAAIRKDGFRSGWLNTLPPYQGGEPQNVIDRRYAPRKGQMVYLVPKEGLQRIDKYSDKIRNGWKPAPHEALRASQDYPDMYQEYLRAHREAYPDDS